MKTDFSKDGYKEAVLSIFVNFFLFLIKFWVGVSAKSIALVADAWHTLSDSISSIGVFVGFKLSEKPPDEKHPFGHGRFEVIVSIFVAVFLGFIGFEFFTDSIKGILHHKTVIFGKFAVIVTIISIVAKELLAQVALFYSKKHNSMLLKADAWHHRSDAISSLVILIGIFLNKYFWWMDSVLGFIVSTLIFYVAYDILNKSISKLLGEKPSEELESQLRSLVCKEEKLKFHHLHIHDYGLHKEITFHIKVAPQKSIAEAHKIADCLEKKIRETLGYEATIHIEPDL